ncbi:MAG: zinc finger Ran-binding domain-containing protein, partial [Gemmatimonadetes bacterium]|nr:zinc finger Ran-binding domain-containing protein [Gemmatimonadota bacterium]
FDVPPPVEERAPDAAAAADEWDPFGEEFGAEPKPSDAEEDLPWLEGIDQAATGQGWAPPAAAGDEGLEFLREIEESSRPVAEPAGDDLGADDLAFLEELDRAIGSGPGSTGRAPKQPPSAEPAAPPPAAASSGAGARAEPLLCKECGAINEPHSWYCEICGSEL